LSLAGRQNKNSNQKKSVEESKMHRIPRLLPVLLFTLFTAGCSLPIQVASLVADGISLFTTEKTVSDHGISMAMDKDCAVWRGLGGDEICKDKAKGAVMTASRSGPVASLAAAGPSESSAAAGRRLFTQVESVEKEILSAIPAAAAKPSSNPRRPAARQPTFVLALAESNSFAAFDAAVAAAKIANDVKTAKQARPVAAAKPGQASQGGGEKGGLHFVLASFSIRGNAEKLVRLNAGLSPKVVTVKVKNRAMHRVVVGPFAAERRKTTRKRLADSGFASAWGIRLQPATGGAMLAALPERAGGSGF
jgi:hypothetical protein